MCSSDLPEVMQSYELAKSQPKLDSSRVQPVAATSGSAVSAASSDAEMAKSTPAPAAPVIVAPSTTNVSNSSSNYAVKPPVRNNDSTMNRFLNNRYSVA